MNAFVAEGIPCFSGSCSEIYREHAFTSANLGPAAPLSVARELGESSLMFLVHPTLTAGDMLNTAAVARKIFAQITS